MSRIVTAILAAIALAAPLCAVAADPPATPPVRGVGVSPCVNWSESLRLTDDRTVDGARLIFVSWVLGFAAGYERTNPPLSLDNDALISGVDGYCAAHPMDTVQTALIAVIADHTPRG